MDVVMSLITDNLNYWIGAKDVEGNNQHVWMGGQILPDNCSLWQQSYPLHGPEDCVYLYEAVLYDNPCTQTKCFVCMANP